MGDRRQCVLRYYVRKEEEEQTSHLNGCAQVEYVQTKSLCQSSRLSHFITFLSDCLRGCDAVTVMLNSSFSAVERAPHVGSL